uniref:Fibrocystin-L n=1 Tax=Leptobrachium leishanense TaxID=445787 RepID=A0A8C5WI58_9ANUR
TEWQGISGTFHCWFLFNVIFANIGIMPLSAGFAEANQFNYGDGNDNLGNKVQMVSSTMSFPCDVEKDASHATQITCYTSMSPQSCKSVQIQAQLSFILILFFCSPGSLITISGYIITDVFGSSTALNTNGRNTRILRSLPDISTYFVSSINKITMFQTYAEITSISPSGGSVQGGTLITITGRYFDQTDSPAKVLVGGYDCIVTGLTDTQITCKSPPKPAVLPTLFPGNRGLKMERWNNTYAVDNAVKFNENSTGYAGQSWVDSAYKKWASESSFTVRLGGFLVPSETDFYRFYIRGDDLYSLYFNISGEPADKVKVAYGSSITSSYYTSDRQKSEEFYLQKDKPYYIEMYLGNYGSAAIIDVGLYKRGSSYLEGQTSDAVNEIQVIQSQTTKVLETQIISVKNWSSSTPVQEVQTIRITKNCSSSCPPLYYKLIYDGEKTGTAAFSTQLQSALNNLWSLKPDSVQVTMESNDLQTVYSVTYISQRGDFQLLSYEIPAGSNMTIDVEEQIKGAADMNTFTLRWNGVYSKPLSVNASSAEVRSAVLEMVGPLCPNAIDNRTESSSVKYFRNYETSITLTGSNRGTLTSQTEAFCGRYSLLNPTILFDSEDLNPSQGTYGYISLALHSQLCFAYKGFLENNIVLMFQYDGTSSTVLPEISFSNPFNQEDSWTYTCIDMLSLIKSRYTGKNYKVYRVSIKPISNVYIDDLYIGQIATTNNVDVERRMPALTGSGIAVNDVTVTRLSNDLADHLYTITIIPHGCGYGFPLFSVGFAEVSRFLTPLTAYKYDNGVKPCLKPDMSTQDLQYALQTIPELGQVSVYARDGSCTGYNWYFKYLTAAGYQPLLQINDSAVTGVNPKISAVKKTSGGLFRQHLFGDLLRTPHANPQVEVRINGVPSKCVGDCSYMWDHEQTPAIDSINVTSVFQFPNLNDLHCHESADTQRYEHFQFLAVAHDVTACSLCMILGGTLVTIQGKGFSNDSAVQFGNVTCDVVRADLNTIRCRTPSGAEGPVNAVVFTNGLNGTSENAFLYSSSNTPTISKISPVTTNVLGKNWNLWLMFLKRRNMVLVGDKDCKIIAWNPTNITCVLPSLSPGIHHVLAYVENWGFASLTVKYTLKVSSIFPQYGSLYGGTKITLAGFGFNEALEQNTVKIGSVPCDVTSRSETNITCVIQKTGTVYNVSNSGVHAVYGFGYAWSPSRLDISVGDTVVWSWNTQALIQDIGYRVFSVSDPANVTYDGKGFYSGDNRLSSGVFSYQFTSPGVYYYSSGYVDNGKTIFMQGTVYVSPAQDQNRGVYLSVGGIEAEYIPAPAPDYPPAECITENPVCPDLSDVPPENNTVWFGFTRCYSPTITRISPSSGTKYDRITINGTGFSNMSCANQVTVGKYPCTVSHADENSIVCQVDPQNAMSVGIAELVSLTVSNHGNAINTMTQEMERRFALLPHIDNITPTNGSTTGFTRLTIQGSGFSNDNGSITIAGIACSITSVNYTHIICDTQPSYTQNAYISVSVNGIPCQCMRSCYFLYTADVTPVILDVYPAIIHNVSTTLYINGSGFGDNVDDILVYAGDVMLEVVDVNDTLISCTIDPLPAGTYAVQVIVLNKGLASGNPTISSPAEATIITTSGSIQGGTVLVIQGNGFNSINATKVSIGGIMCPIISVSAGEIRCVTPAATSAGEKTVSIVVQSSNYPSLRFTYSESYTPTVTSVLPNTGPSGTLITVSGSRFGVDATKVAVNIGGTQCNISNVKDTELQCTVGDHPGGTYPVRLQNEKGYARTSANFKYELTLSSVSPNQGSFGGGLVITLTGSGFDRLTSNVSVCNSECKVDRLDSNSNTLLCETPAQNGKTCDVRIVNGNDIVQINNSFSYSTALTPVVHDVTPKRGGTGGGTRLTITGSNFSDNFFYIDVWSSKYTWGGESPPDEGSLAVITQGQTILLDQSTPVLKMLLIQGGTLVFDEADIELQSENILITNGGSLQIGTESAPFQHKAIITLHGHLRSPELPVYGAKTLAVREGTLDLHGLPVPVTWTRLAQTADAGTSTITLQQSVTWKAGDEIVIASTGNRLSQKENEKKTILSLSADGKTLNLTEPLTYKHLGISITLPDNSVFEARAEVGLLTRNIVVRGSTNMEWSETISACPDGFDPGEFATQTCFQGRFGEESNSDQFGGCIMFHAPTADKRLAIGRIEYVEIFHAGQAFRLGRYPIHFHLMGDLQFKSYVRGCGIHQTYNRAVTIHNTHHLLIERNVIYDIMGGAFFIEDGIEHGNVLQYNLAVFVRQSTSLLNDDVTPAGFWVTNPNNTIRHNVAAGGTHFGFWYRMHQHPDGPSYDENICQQRVPLGEFYNNTVHSQGWFGIWIFESYFPMSQGSCSSSTPQPAIFKSLTTWNCQKGAEWVQGGALQFHNFSMINNEDAGIETKRVISTYVGGWGEVSGAVIKNTAIVGHVDELGLGSNFCTAKGIILPFDEGLTVSSVKFMNFDRPNCAAIGVTSVTGLCSDRCGGWSAKFDGIQYFNTPNKAGFRWEHEVVLIDTDGTLAGGAGYKVVPESGLLDPSQCSKAQNWSIGFPGHVCQPAVTFHRLAFNNPTPTSLLGKNVIISNSFGASVVPYLAKRLTHPKGWMALLPNANSFNWYFRNAAFITNISYSSTFYGFKNEEYIMISHNLTQRPDMFRIVDVRNMSLETLSYSNSSNGDWTFNNNTKTLTYIVSGKRKVQRRAVAGTLDPSMSNINVNLLVYQCYYKDCITPAPPTTAPTSSSSGYVLWSNRSFWESSAENKYTVPTEGSDVVIPPGILSAVVNIILHCCMNRATISTIAVYLIIDVKWTSIVSFIFPPYSTSPVNCHITTIK